MIQPPSSLPVAARYPIGIAAGEYVVYVLCSDGAVFARMGPGSDWTRIQPVPGTPAAAVPGTT